MEGKEVGGAGGGVLITRTPSPMVYDHPSLGQQWLDVKNTINVSPDNPHQQPSWLAVLARVDGGGAGTRDGWRSPQTGHPSRP